MRHEQEKRPHRRFFKTFEQGVDRALLHVVGRIDDDCPATTQRRPGGQPVLDLAHLIDRDVALGRIGLALVALLGLVIVGRQML